MARFYETTILVDPPPPSDGADELWGIQVLASPPTVGGAPVDYGPLLDRLRAGSTLRPVSVSGDKTLVAALSALADPEWNRRWAHLGEFALGGPLGSTTRTHRLEIGEYLLYQAPIAAETSPLTPQLLVRLAGEAGTVTFLMIAGSPALVIVGTVGLAVLRGLGAVGGALWRGAEPNVERFGESSSAKLRDALSKRLNLDSTSDNPADDDRDA